MDHLTFETRKICNLRPYSNNPRTHSKKQVRQLANSIERFGWTNPLLIDANNGVIAGHGRLEAAKLLGLPDVPVLRIDHMSDAEKRAYIIADNKLAENAGWDRDLLGIELQGLLDMDVEIDVELTGFEMGEIDILLEEASSEIEDNVPSPDKSTPAVSRPGDLWLNGPHRILCADSLSPVAWGQLMEGELAQMAFTDPPYNVRIGGNVSGLGKTRHREFAMASGEMSSDEFTDFLHLAFQRHVEHSCDGSIHYVCMDWRHISEVFAASDGAHSELKNLCVWDKKNAGMGTFYRSQHELIFVFKSGSAPHINNFGLGETGRHRSNVWSYPGANTFRKGRAEDLAAHPTVKPVAMVTDAILDCSKRNGLVIDGFAGVGTTVLAAAHTGRRGYGIEIDPHYVDIAVDRLQRETGEPTIHADSFESFETVTALRAKETHNVQA